MPNELLPITPEDSAELKAEYKRNREEIFGKETQQAKAERLEMEWRALINKLKKDYIAHHNNGIEQIADHLIERFKLNEKTVSDLKLASEIQKILEELCNQRTVNEIIKKIGFKTYGMAASGVIEITEPQDFLQEKYPARNFIVDPLVPADGITMVAGQPSSGKSWFLLELAKQVAKGERFLGQFATKQTKTLQIDLESSRAENQRRWRMVEVNNIGVICRKRIRFDNENAVIDLAGRVADKGYKLVMIDAMADTHLMDENLAKDMQQLMNAFNEFVERGITVIIVHHTRKQQFLDSKDLLQIIRGSSNIPANLSALLHISKKPKTTESFQLTVTQAKLREGKETNPFRVDLTVIDGKMTFSEAEFIEDTVTKLENAMQAVREYLTENETHQAEIIRILTTKGFAKQTLRNAIKELKERNEIDEVIGGAGKKVLSFKQAKIVF